MVGVASQLVEPRPFGDTHAHLRTPMPSKQYTESALEAPKAEKLVLDQYKADKVTYMYYTIYYIVGRGLMKVFSTVTSI